MVDLQIITADDILTQIRKKKKRTIALLILLILIGVGALVYSVIAIRVNHDYGSGAVGAIICVVLCAIGIVMIKKNAECLKDLRHCRVFKKYGTPEEIASRISASAGNRLMDSKRLVLTDDFIMKTNDFETFVPLEAVLLAYKYEHSTNGVKDSVAISIHDEYGDKFEYPISIRNSKNSEELNTICNAIAQRSERVKFGYNGENLKYVEANQKRV